MVMLTSLPYSSLLEQVFRILDAKDGKVDGVLSLAQASKNGSANKAKVTK
jgi:hypothetical protein